MLEKKLSKRLGQHFLQDMQALTLEASLLDITNKHVLEIGAGDGRLSNALLSKNPKKLTLIELDTYWANYLSKRFSTNSNVNVLHQDILDLDDNFDSDIIYGNIPYNITSQILEKLSKLKFENCILCMQKEVVQRVCAPPSSSNYGRLSVFCQLHFQTNPLYVFEKELFTPIPKVDSQLIQLIPNKKKNIPKNFELIGSALFSHRLASVKNALFHSRKKLGFKDKDLIRDKISKLNNINKKVFMLTPNEVLDICKSFT